MEEDSIIIKKQNRQIIILSIIIVILLLICFYLFFIRRNSDENYAKDVGVDSQTENMDNYSQNNNIIFTRADSLNVWDITQNNNQSVTINNKSVVIKVEEFETNLKVFIDDVEIANDNFDYIYVTDYFMLLAYGQGRKIGKAFDENANEISISNNDIQIDKLYVENGRLYATGVGNDENNEASGEDNNESWYSCWNCSNQKYEFVYDGKSIVITKVN